VALSILCLSLSAQQAARADLVRNISTGFNNQTNSLLTPFAQDTDYTVIGPNKTQYLPQARAEGAGVLPNTYVGDADMPGSRWLYLVSDPNNQGDFFAPSGLYTFTTIVNLSGFNPTTARLAKLAVSADNALVSVSVNAATVYSRTPGPAPEEFTFVRSLGTLGAGAFHSGSNTVSFTIDNFGFGFQPGVSPAAFRAVGEVDATPVAQTPEPAAWVLFGLGGLATAGRRLWHRRPGQGR
jgi:hypothetical protein